MKGVQLKNVLVSGCIAYAIGVAAFLTSFFIPVMSNPEHQANVVLAFAIIPAAIVGATYYLKRDQGTSGIVLGIGMFLTTMLLDALITVPFFVIPQGGDHISFFADPGFWGIALLYIAAVIIYVKSKRKSAWAKK
ncbi:DUF5367 family protein [Ulvibacterium sp.]|uniref:DUF5367 family protein n=1 Tax=Ulvibacterium sp. TaxID=2665914 RepID=UPI00260177AE|nr:DUF5367 family protein [Ulvibacterium sp.]